MKKKYTSEFKDQAVSLVREADRPAAEVARELGIKVNTLYSWLGSISSSDAEDSSKDNYLKEIKRLKKELSQANLERDILKKAAAYFAKETL